MVALARLGHPNENDSHNCCRKRSMTEQAMFVPCTSVVHAADIAERVKNFSLFGVPISRLNFQDTIAQVMNWAEQRERTRLVTFSNVHMLTEGHKKPWF